MRPRSIRTIELLLVYSGSIQGRTSRIDPSIRIDTQPVAYRAFAMIAFTRARQMPM